ncbi:putative transcription initiation factor TFIID subunit 7 [Apostichopus japonicus]|uniref:Putative transcription initiation factor TFIID subunit 7 n=1 Tax=Stichopus japonicus TaxID=307972 RepID=A0A2G8JPS3_STIJA|nr:putative transcription initiation factor TFIID subunit 7 [Apostichopus japonicus]
MGAPVKKDEAPLELESQMILRLPEHAAEEARKLVIAGTQNLKDKLNIDLRGDGRHAIVRFDQEEFAAKLVDLPCVLESHKTFDKKTLWKTADISQMLVCTDDPLPLNDEDNKLQRRPANEKVDKKFVWNHGITPPLKNVRKRRFRKSARKKYIEAPDIEEEVKRLLRMDSTAIKIRWEVLADEEVKDDNRPGSSTAGDDLQQIFADVSSSEDEGQDINVEDDEGTRDSIDMMTDIQSQELTQQEEDAGSKVIEADEENSQEQSVLTQRYTQLQKELEDLETRELALGQSLETVENVNLKQRFLSQLDQVMEEKKQKQKEAETLQAIVGNG